MKSLADGSGAYQLTKDEALTVGKALRPRVWDFILPVAAKGGGKLLLALNAFAFQVWA